MAERFSRTPLFVLIGGTCIVLVSYGVRASFGLFLAPISADFGWGRETLSFAIAMQNLMIGLLVPFCGAVADRYGLTRVLVTAGAAYALGVAGMALSTSLAGMVLSAGLLVGFGVSGTGLGLVLSVIGRVAPEEKRSLWLGIGTAGGTAGQMLVVPLGQGMIDWLGWANGLFVLAALSAILVPMAMGVGRAVRARPFQDTGQRLVEALREAASHRGYLLLVSGFFVCGFQVQFIAVHLPAFVTDRGGDAMLGAVALSLIGFFNMIGTWTAGYLGGRFSKKSLLAAIYAGRAVIFLGFLYLPIDTSTILLLSALTGLLWLGTVPLSSGIVAQVFGTRYMATLYGFVYLSHQLGSFSGIWLGGLIFDATGDYDAMWWCIIAAGLFATLVHLAIDERPLARLAALRG